MRLSEYIKTLQQLQAEVGDVRVMKATWGGGMGSVQEANLPRKFPMKLKSSRESYEKVVYADLGDTKIELSGETVVQI